MTTSCMFRLAPLFTMPTRIRRLLPLRRTVAATALFLTMGVVPVAARQSETLALEEQPQGLMLAHHLPQQGPDPLPGGFSTTHEEAPVPPNTGPISLAMGADWVSAYYFRGIVFQESGGDNVQPYLELRFRLLENLGPLTSLTVAGGVWESFHSGGGTLVEPSDPKFWFESNLDAKLTATWWKVLTTGVTFTYYDSPNDSFSSLSDIAINTALDDSQWLGAFALNPSLVFAFQTKGHFVPSADTDGIYMGLGLAPGYTLFKDSKYPVNVSLPMTFGFSVSDYYTTANGQNQTFGYFQGGPLLTIPLNFISDRFGQWAFRGGVQFLALNSNLKEIDAQGDGFVPIGSVGFSMTY